MVRRLLVVLVAFVTLNGCRQSPADELYAAVRELPYRPTKGRLSGLPYAVSPALRRDNQATAGPELNARKFARLLRLSQGSEELRARVMLVGGETGVAKSILERITLRGNASAAEWNDYATVLHADAAPNDARQLSMALAAADRALDLQPDYPEALFNRAIVLEELSLRGEAIAAYNKYLRVDPSSQWAAEARGHLQKIEVAQTRAAAWRETIDDLDRAAEAGDELFINDIAISYPQEARSWAEYSLGR
jgi:tetratricopeptide (TPR) repeat protein